MKFRCNAGVKAVVYLRVRQEQLIEYSVAILCKSTHSKMETWSGKHYKDMQIHLHTLKSSRCTGKPKRVKLLRRAILSLFCFLCLFSTWKSDATKLNPTGTRVLWPGRPSCQQSKSVQGEEFGPWEISLPVYCMLFGKTYMHTNISLFKKSPKNEDLREETNLPWFEALPAVDLNARLDTGGITLKIDECILHPQPISVHQLQTHHHQHQQNETNGNGLVIVLSMPCCKKYQQLCHMQREGDHFAKVGVIWHCGRGGPVAGSDIESNTVPGLGKVTIGLMGKRAVMSSHGRKTPLSRSFSLPNVRVKGTRRESPELHTHTQSTRTPL